MQGFRIPVAKIRKKFEKFLTLNVEKLRKSFEPKKALYFSIGVGIGIGIEIENEIGTK